MGEDTTIAALMVNLINCVIAGESNSENLIHHYYAGFGYIANSLVELKKDILNADGIVISVNEHNGGLSAYFKNLIDWLSRLDRDFIRDKKVLLMSTSPGKRGAIGAHEAANKMLSRFGAEILGSFSLPSFYDNFDVEKGIIDVELSKQHQGEIATFISKI